MSGRADRWLPRSFRGDAPVAFLVVAPRLAGCDPPTAHARNGTVDVVVSNPPYVPEGAELPPDVAEWEPGSALYSGPDGTGALRELVEGAGEWLRDDGVLVCELSPEQADAMAELAGAHFAEVHVAADLTGRDRALVARRPLRAAGHPGSTGA